MIKDFKYFLAYIIPASGFLAVTYKGYYSYLTVIVAFVIIPILEQLFPVAKDNYSPLEKERRSHLLFFDLLLLINIPMLYLLLAYGLYTFHTVSLVLYEKVGLILSIGIVAGASGINVAHELGHRSNKWYQWAAKILLLPELYMHFIIEHNRGHHLRVGTTDDPATSRFGEWIFLFWFRSIIMGYISAWKLEANRLSRTGGNIWSLKNEMWKFTMLQFSYLLMVFIFFDWRGIIVSLGIALIAILLLETINYIEHYGLVRKRKNNGRYENVELIHSWNSDHLLGRIILYELTRHSDHHYKSNKKYQILSSHHQSPQLPLGYPGSMLLALVPPLWFKLMNRRLHQYGFHNG